MLIRNVLLLILRDLISALRGADPSRFRLWKSQGLSKDVVRGSLLREVSAVMRPVSVSRPD